MLIQDADIWITTSDNKHIGVECCVIKKYCTNVYRAGSLYVVSHDKNIYLFDVDYDTLIQVLSQVYTGEYECNSGYYTSVYKKLGINPFEVSNFSYHIYISVWKALI